MNDEDYATFKCKKCGQQYGWISENNKLEGCLTCGLCSNCLK